MLEPNRIEVLDNDIVAVLRSKTPADRVAMMFSANRTMRLRLEGHFRTLHPEWDAKTIKAAIARRMTGGTARAPAADD